MKNQLNQPNFSLLETILWQPNDGYFVLDHHLKRLQSSAIYLSAYIKFLIIQSFTIHFTATNYISIHKNMNLINIKGDTL